MRGEKEKQDDRKKCLERRQKNNKNFSGLDIWD